MANILSSYLAATPASAVTAPMAGYVAALDQIYDSTPDIAAAVVQELADQRAHLKLIASENYASLAVQSAMGNLLTDKYAEGVPGHRFYAGCANVDEVERRAAKLACDLFGAEHAYVQPHSGADANLVAYWAILAVRVEQPRLAQLEVKSPLALEVADWERLRAELGNQRLLGMDLGSGGHLTHGYRPNVSGRMFECHGYGVDAATGLLDYAELERRARQVRPLILLAGYSAYPRAIDFRRLRRIAAAVGAVLMVDMAHFAGLVAGRVLHGDYDPVPFADVVTSTTHKTLRGPRGGLILCRKEFAEAVDRGCPLVLGGPLPHVIAAKAVALAEATQPEFAGYARRIVENAQALAAACTDPRPGGSHRRHRQSPAAAGRHALGTHRAPGRVGASRRRHHGQSQRPPGRSPRPLVHLRIAPGYPGADHTRDGHGADGRSRRGDCAGARRHRTRDHLQGPSRRYPEPHPLPHRSGDTVIRERGRGTAAAGVCGLSRSESGGAAAPHGGRRTGATDTGLSRPRPARLERATCSLEGCCSIRLSYGRKGMRNATACGAVWQRLGANQRQRGIELGGGRL